MEHARNSGTGRLLLALLLCLTAAIPAANVWGGSTEQSGGAQASAPADLAAAMAAYHRQLNAYMAAWTPYDAAASANWNAIEAKRSIRRAKRRNEEAVTLDDYVLTQPPVYTGPPRPVDPSGAPEREPRHRWVPVVTDVLLAAAAQYSFVPELPGEEAAYKRAYAQVAAAAGLTRAQVVRIYGFEAGGDGKYDTQAGLEYPRPDAHAISTALGYNQLLHTNSVELMAEKGDQFVRALTDKAARLSGAARTALDKKIAIVRRMIAVSRSVPDSWNEHRRLAETPAGLGIHAVELDIDIGPLLQVQKLVDSIRFAHANGYAQPLTAAELEMMNLTGDGNGLDMVMMPVAMRAQVPTANFFQRDGYARNRVAIRNNLVATLLAATDAKMDGEMRLAGARELAAAYPP